MLASSDLQRACTRRCQHRSANWHCSQGMPSRCSSPVYAVLHAVSNSRTAAARKGAASVARRARLGMRRTASPTALAQVFVPLTYAQRPSDLQSACAGLLHTLCTTMQRRQSLRGSSSIWPTVVTSRLAYLAVSRSTRTGPRYPASQPTCTSYARCCVPTLRSASTSPRHGPSMVTHSLQTTTACVHTRRSVAEAWSVCRAGDSAGEYARSTPNHSHSGLQMTRIPLF